MLGILENNLSTNIDNIRKQNKEDDRPDPDADYREGEEEDYLDELDKEEDQAEPDLETDPEDAADSEK